MKVALVTNTHYDVIIPLAKHLSKLMEIDLFSIISRKGSGRQTFFESDKLWETESPGVIEDVDRKGYINSVLNDYVSAGFRNHALYFTNLAFFKPGNIIMSFRIAAYLKKQKYDLIHFNGTSLLFYLLRLFIRKIPFVLTTHDPTPHSGEDNYVNRFIRRLMNRKNHVQHIIHSDALISEFKANFPKISRDKLHVIYYGTIEWLTHWKSNESPDRTGVLFFGRISKYKGIEYLIEAAKIVRDTIPDLRVVIAGSGKFDIDLEPYINDKTFNIINSYISNQKLAELIQNAAIVVCPYTDATQSGVIMSAFAFQKPVIASEVGGIPDVIENGVTGILVPPKDSKRLAESMTELLNDPVKLTDLSKNIEERYSTGRFSWQNIADQTALVYKQAISGS